jgi:hypothetical protein
LNAPGVRRGRLPRLTRKRQRREQAQLTGGIPIPKWLAEDHGLSGDQSVALYDEATGIWRSYFKFVKDADAQTYTSTARVQVGGGNASTPKSAKIQYDNVGRGNAGQTVTIKAPVSIDVKSGNARTSYPIARGAKFRLAKNVPGASINETTGEITYKIPAGTRGTVDIPVAVDYPVIYHVSSGGNMLAKPNFGGVGEDNYLADPQERHLLRGGYGERAHPDWCG